MSTAQPRVWVLLSYRAGENTQLRALAAALAWPVEEKRLHYHPLAWRSHLLCQENLQGVDLNHADPLIPPWPDVVISAAVRNEPVARWIRRQAAKPVRLIFLGRVWAALEHFDLVITTAQYRLPEHPRVLHNLGTQQAVNDHALVTARERWQAELASLPQPRVAVLVGGSSGPYALDRHTAIRLAEECSALVAVKGSLMLSTSSRTPAVVCDTLARSLRVPHRLYRWSPDDDSNPYWGFLAWADQLVVTGDSIAMLSEACATGKPVAIFDLGTGAGAMGPVGAALPGRPWWRDWSFQRLQALAYGLLLRLGPRRLGRDITRVHRALVDSGRAVWLGQPLPQQPPPPLEDQTRAVAAIRALLASPQAPRTWLLLGHKAGDNTQLRALAAALGWPCEEKHLRYHPWELLSGRLLGATLLGLDRARSDQLRSPWPELILTAGRRNEPVARWIRQQAGSGVRIVHVGRPWASLEHFDLLIATPQYSLPPSPRVQINRLPLQQLGEVDGAELQRWSARLAHLPRPWTTVLVGGQSGPYHFNAPEARQLGAALGLWLRQRGGGSLLLSTSARTGAAASEALAASLPAAAYLHCWGDGENPYQAFLALADDLVVTGESMSMLAEACATGKPVQVFPLGAERFAMGPRRQQATSPWWREPRNWHFRPLSHRVAMSLAPRRLRRDVRIVLDDLVASGRVNWLGDTPVHASGLNSSVELQQSAARVRELMGFPAEGELQHNQVET